LYFLRIFSIRDLHKLTQREKVLWNKQYLFSVKESVVSIWARKYLFLALVLFI
jgi:hypothetical protein